MTEQEWREEFSRKLRKVLAERDITQAELASIVNIAECTISRYMNCSRTPSGYIISEICDALNLPQNYFRINMED